jgi:hypothetical protein
VEDAHVLDFNNEGDVTLVSLLDSNNAEHKRAAEQSKTELEQWFGERIKAHPLVRPCSGARLGCIHATVDGADMDWLDTS